MRHSMILKKFIVLAKKKLSIVLLLLILMIPFPVAASTITVTFEDLTMPTGYISPGLSSSILDGYKGFDWNNFAVIDPVFVGDPFTVSGYTNGTVSGSRVGFSPGAFSSIISTDDGNLFDFNSAYFTGAWNNSLSVWVAGYNNSFLVNQREFKVDTSAPLFVEFDYLDIDMLEIKSYGGYNAGLGGYGQQVAIDNMRFTQGNNPVPEPATIALLGIGLAGLAGAEVRRRRKKKAVDKS